MLVALRIQRDAETIAFTHWTFDQLDEAPADRLGELRTYLSMKSGIEEEKMKMDSH